MFKYRYWHKHWQSRRFGVWHSILGLTPVFLMIFIGFWWTTHSTGYFYSKEFQLLRFHGICNDLNPKLKDYYQEHGRYPETLDEFGYHGSNFGYHGSYNEYFDKDTSQCDFVFFYFSTDSCYRLVTWGGEWFYINTKDTSFFTIIQ